MTRESLSAFSTKKAFSQAKFTTDLRWNSKIILTVSAAFNVGVSTFSRDEKIKNNRGGFYWIHWLENYGLPWSWAILFSILIAEAIGVSHSMVLRQLRDLFGMKNCDLRWISQAGFIFQKAHKSFSMKIFFTVFWNLPIHQISYTQIWPVIGNSVYLDMKFMNVSFMSLFFPFPIPTE
jgi:hypothetical protein